MGVIAFTRRLFVALLLPVLLAVLLFSDGHMARAETGTTDPITGQIHQVAIDMITTGNSAGTGTTGTGCPGNPCTVT